VVCDLFLALEANKKKKKALNMFLLLLIVGFRRCRTSAALCSLQLLEATIPPAAAAQGQRVAHLQNFALRHNCSA